MQDVIENQGWIKLYRKSLYSSAWKDSKTWKVWSWCLAKARHQDGCFPFNGTDMVLKRGQFITGRTAAITDLVDVTASEYRSRINYLKSTNRITVKPTNRFSVISVVNWDEYQIKNEDDDQKTANEQPSSEHQITTNKNVENVENFILLADKSAKDTNSIVNKEINTQLGEKNGVSLKELYAKMSVPRPAQANIQLWQSDAAVAVDFFVDGKVEASSIYKCFKDNHHQARIAFSDCKELKKKNVAYFFKVYSELKPKKDATETKTQISGP